MEKTKQIIKTIVMVMIVIIIFDKLSYFGLFGLFGILALVIGRRIWKNREMLMEGIRNIETLLWGKPLDKGTWKKGELKAKWKRTKFVWKDDQPININWRPFLYMILWALTFMIGIWMVRS